MKNNHTQPQKTTENASEQIDAEKPGGLLAWIQHIPVFLFNEQKLTQTRKAIVLNDLVDSSSPGMDYFILIFLSCTIATFGLLTDSAAVIIGAMLVAPLMSPILSLSMASISGLSRLFKRSVLAIFEGAGIAILLSGLIAFLSYRLPLGINANIPNEVLARTSPSPMDLGIALAGGAAAAYALAHPRLTAALPGVAIATALMPPLCAVGVGLAFMNSTIIFGALLLFVTNLVAIAFAGIVTFAVMGFGPRNAKSNNKVSQSLSIASILVIVIGLLLAGLAWNTISEARLYTRARAIILDSANQYTDVQLVDMSISTEADVKYIKITLRTTRDLTFAEVSEMQDEIAAQLNSPVALTIISIPMQILTPEQTATPIAAP
jgi:uncharacterized hydrophobic protein (TIGR00271 family)